MRHIALFAALGLVIGPTVADDFVPFTEAQKALYRFDFSRIYRDEATWDRDLEDARQLAAKMQGARGRVTASGTALYDLLMTKRRLDQTSNRLELYRYFRYATDTRLEPQLSAASDAIAGLRAGVAFVDVELTRLTPEELDRLLGEEPRLAPLRFALEQRARHRPHTLTAEQEELLSRLAPQLHDWPGQLFQKLIDRTPFPDLATPSGPRNVYRDRLELAKEPDRELRRRAMLDLRSAYDANADLFGFAFIKQAGTLQAEATARGFPDAFAASLFDDHLSTAQADAFFRTIADFAPLSRRYHELRKARIARVAKLDQVAPWDMEVVPPGFTRPRFTIDDATAALTAALAFHGPRYAEDLAALLDPANGRLDLVAGPGRVPGAFSWGDYGDRHLFYADGFHGYLDDVLALAHEAGHAVHFDLVAKNGVPPEYAEGPVYFTESFAMLNEFVTADHLAATAKTAEERIYFLEQLLDIMMRRFFDIVRRSEFEYLAFRKIQSGEISQPEQLHELWRQEGLRYFGEDYDTYPFLRPAWAMTPHFFRSPRYFISYLFANLMAVSYFERRRSDPSFDTRYMELIVNGFPDTPLHLLERHLGLDPLDPSRIAGAMRVFEAKVAELEALYRDAAARPGGGG